MPDRLIITGGELEVCGFVCLFWRQKVDQNTQHTHTHTHTHNTYTALSHSSAAHNQIVRLQPTKLNHPNHEVLFRPADRFDLRVGLRRQRLLQR
jgi:hypothetical protein